MKKTFLYYFFLFIFCVNAHAQLCQGSLGDPIVNITFGAGSNPGAPLSSAATGYAYNFADCPSDGAYTVRNNTNSCFGSTWHSLSADHTGDAGGYFMLVNASLQPSAFYVDTVKGLCGNSTYEFAAWILNIILPNACDFASSRPNLTFNIETTTGNIIKTYNSGDIQPESFPTWKQYGFFFVTPGGVSNIVLRITNNAAGGCGNDLALDDITFRPCGPLLTPSVSGESGLIANICEGNAETFNFKCAVSGGFAEPAYQWQQRINSGAWTDIADANTTTYTRTFAATYLPGKYEYRLGVAEAGNLAAAQCRISSQPLIININANPVAIASNKTPACTGDDHAIVATGGAGYMWTGPGGYTASGAAPVITDIRPEQAGTYTVIATSTAGCISEPASTVVAVQPRPVAATIESNTSICTRDSIQLGASGGGAYVWSPAAGLSSATAAAPKASPAVTTEYIVTVTNQFMCSDTAYTKVMVVEKAFANAGPDKFFIEGQSVQLTASATGNYQSLSWSPASFISNAGVLQPFVQPPADQAYILTVQSNNNCGTSSDTVQVKFYKAVFIPTAFSPNGDAINRVWNIPALHAFPGFKLTVFNRYGQVVFTTNNADLGWDGRYKGRPAEAGVYVYLLDLKKPPGILKGTVMLIR